MKFRIATVVAFSLAFAQITAPAAMAETQFRTVERQAFSNEDLQRYGLSADDAAQVQAYQRQGYQVRVVTPEEASQYQAGISNRTWWIIGAVVVIVAVAAAVD